MSAWKSWLVPGLVTVVLLTALAAFWRLPAVEADISTRLSGMLSGDHGWATTRVDGREVELSGLAPSPEALDAATRAAESANGVRTVSVRAQMLPLAEPYRISVEFRDGAATLAGYAPDEATHSALVAAIAAALPGVAIDDRLELARGAPDGYVGLAAFTFAQLSALSEGRIELVGTEISVAGTAKSPVAHENAVAALSAGLPGARIARLEIAPAVVSPFRWSMTRDAGQVTFAGFAPDAPGREAAFAAARQILPDDRIGGSLPVASGLDNSIDWAQASRFMLSQLSGLASGTVAVSDGLLELDGRAANPDAYATINSAISGALPAGLRLARAALRPPLFDPYEWSLEFASDRGAVVAGHAPDAETARLLLDLARAVSPPDAEVTDRQQIGDGAPPEFETAIRAAVGAMRRLASGRLTVSRTGITVDGLAFTGPAANEIRSKIAAALPSGFRLVSQIGVRPVDGTVDAVECQNRLNATLRDTTVEFETGTATIAEGSRGLLDELAYVLRHCPTETVEIGGHTDSDGSEETNLALSRERAAAVVAYLARAGTLPGRLRAKGYGESVPVADNATDEGRQRNRRVEFRIVQ